MTTELGLAFRTQTDRISERLSHQPKVLSAPTHQLSQEGPGVAFQEAQESCLHVCCKVH